MDVRRDNAASGTATQTFVTTTAASGALVTTAVTQAITIAAATDAGMTLFMIEGVYGARFPGEISISNRPQSAHR